MDAGVLRLAEANLRLLTATGMARRQDVLTDDARIYDKPAHHASARAARRLAAQLEDDGGDLPAGLHHLDARDGDGLRHLVARWTPDVVLADLPHGRMTRWAGHDELDEAADQDADQQQRQVVATLARVLPPTSVVVVVTRARRVRLPAGSIARDRVRVGHRAAAIFRAGDVADHA